MHYIELIATITGFLYIIYTIREKMLLWFFGIVSSALYVGVFYRTSLYAYSVLYIYYVIIGFYGWYNWSRPIRSQGLNSARLTIRRASIPMLVSCIAGIFIFAIPVYFLLKKYTETDVALLDALLSSAGMVATWMLTQKFIEQWIFWIIIDVITCSLMIYKGLFPSSILFLAYTLLALKGFITWKKELEAATIRS
jgi:nicotinamide mononucleotide transporter